MTMQTVDCRALHSPAAEQYFTRHDRRYMIGLRATLELLGLPLPDYATRRKPGPTPARRVLDALKADDPTYRPLTLAPRKQNADPATVAAARAGRAFQ